MMPSQNGHAAVEYMLVVAVVVLGLVAAIYLPGKNRHNLGDSLKTWHRGLGERVGRP